MKQQWDEEKPAKRILNVPNVTNNQTISFTFKTSTAADSFLLPSSLCLIFLTDDQNSV